MEITTQNGTVLELCPVSELYITSIRNQARADFITEHGELLPIPGYTTTCGGGEFGTWEEPHDHTEETIEDANEYDKHKWKLYTEQQRELSSLIWMRTGHAYLVRGVANAPPDDGWRERQEKDRLEIPTDPDEVKRHWIETECVMSSFELGMIVRTIRAQSNHLEVSRQLAVDTFRRQVEFAGRPDPERVERKASQDPDIAGELVP